MFRVKSSGKFSFELGNGGFPEEPGRRVAQAHLLLDVSQWARPTVRVELGTGTARGTGTADRGNGDWERGLALRPPCTPAAQANSGSKTGGGE